ncbi:isopentenyl-diphosphate delta-isomerase [Melghiribacillus thermohalophilus]|uniref:Isopentenyl-diphosphate delta-isomerase n=1 Tax=Melghiribacillus thermohalophilus TaxID=1324956 RepID=A0A4R3NBW3_9BACI|nr:type 2 isopentenyl-diphosphate Delta-isomerase [Melghiribacillus thermohalophilus]TCT26308.1 isopentenyl-diphosphate delta-isomerase [Melghiribacillus thermohalophilus]
MGDQIERRKAQHIDIVMTQDVAAAGITTGFENYRFIHEALPEVNFQDISLSTEFLGKEVKAPFLISSMTGGTEKATSINRHLAEAAEEKGWAMGLGSTRAALEHEAYAHTFQVRKYAPSIPLFANLGAVQLNDGYDETHCRKIVEITEADALVLHLNSLQEVFQDEGDTDFQGLLKKMEQIARRLEVPLGVKEVGWGIHGKLAKRLFDIGISFVDVAGAGGTSWSQVEKKRTKTPIRKLAADAFKDWGIPTAEAVTDVRKRNPGKTVIASGGLQNGVEAAKAIALGADLVGFGRSILNEAIESAEALIQVFDRIEFELKTAMFGIGAENLLDLKQTENLKHIRLSSG